MDNKAKLRDIYLWMHLGDKLLVNDQTVGLVQYLERRGVPTILFQIDVGKTTTCLFIEPQHAARAQQVSPNEIVLPCSMNGVWLHVAVFDERVVRTDQPRPFKLED